MTTDEMVTILEGIIRDEATNPTAKCTAIRTLRQIEEEAGRRGELDDELERLLYDDNREIDSG
jgi:hypothetical protein